MHLQHVTYAKNEEAAAAASSRIMGDGFNVQCVCNCFHQNGNVFFAWFITKSKDVKLHWRNLHSVTRAQYAAAGQGWVGWWLNI